FGVCTHYKYDGKETKDLPYDMVNREIVPTNIFFKSWGTINPTGPISSELQDYVNYLETYLNTKVAMVSNGPGREQLIDLTEGKLLA
ncbi:MAG TPA: adenylosuccinate synthetase, partial [Chitinophagales bacterium]|nr:adenylosuccinate synthetase [Chitinophagales bacterium]